MVERGLQLSLPVWTRSQRSAPGRAQPPRPVVSPRQTLHLVGSLRPAWTAAVLNPSQARRRVAVTQQSVNLTLFGHGLSQRAPHVATRVAS